MQNKKQIEISKNIIICPKCKGYKFITSYQRTSVDDGEYIKVDCTYCNSEGMVIEKITHESI